MQETSVEDREPTPVELARIEAEQPVLAAEFALIEAHVAAQQRPSARSQRRMRRAVVRLLAANRARAHSLVTAGLAPTERWGWAQ